MPSVAVVQRSSRARYHIGAPSAFLRFGFFSGYSGFSWGVPGFLGSVSGFLGVFRVFLGVFRVFLGVFLVFRDAP